jgi:hypothetical protein
VPVAIFSLGLDGTCFSQPKVISYNSLCILRYLSNALEQVGPQSEQASSPEAWVGRCCLVSRMLFSGTLHLVARLGGQAADGGTAIFSPLPLEFTTFDNSLDVILEVTEGV